MKTESLRQDEAEAAPGNDQQEQDQSDDIAKEDQFDRRYVIEQTDRDGDEGMAESRH